MRDLIDRHVRHCLAAGLAETTIDKRKELLNRLDRDLPMGLGQATTEELQDFLAKYRKAETKASYYGHITGFFKWACDPHQPKIDYNPALGLSRPRTPRGLPKPATDDQVAFALATLPYPWLAYVALAVYEGARCIEISRVHRRDITERETRLHGKGDKVRVLKTHAEVWRIVRDLPPGPIAHRVKDTGPVDADYVSTSTRRKLISIGLEGMTLHRFRHWYATTQLKPVKYGGAGASIRTVQENMGHANLASTAIYTLVTNEERADAIDSLPTFTAPSPR
jgi:integrase/recombinase XerC